MQGGCLGRPDTFNVPHRGTESPRRLDKDLEAPKLLACLKFAPHFFGFIGSRERSPWRSAMRTPSPGVIA
jgi:hypothetical protein